MTKSILIVEDEKEQAQALKEFFEALAYSVTVVEDGFDAISEVLAGDYDLITMDLKMSELSGLEATELIRMKHDIATPVIVISGYLSDREESELRDLDVEHFMHKPFDLEELRRVVESAVGDAQRP